MEPQIAEHLPILAGAGALTVSVIVGVIRGYRWFLSQVREVITEAMRSHEAKEGEWQRAIGERLDRLEEKVDRLIEGRH